MNPFERYVAELEPLLPRRIRTDVKKEVLADLWSEFEATHDSQPGDANDRMARIVASRERPEALAASFEVRERALIGASLFPIYRASLAFSCAAIAVCTFAVDRSFASRFVWSEWLNGLALSLMIAFAVVTAVFALVERLWLGASVPLRRIELRSAVAASSTVRVALLQLLFAASLLFVLNFHPGWIGLYVLTDAPIWSLKVVPVLSNDFLARQLLWIDLWCALVVLAAASAMFRSLLAIRRASNLLLQIGGVAIGLRILFDGAIFAAPDTAAFRQFPADVAEQLATLILPGLLKTLLAVFWVGVTVRAVYLMREALAIFRQRRMRMS